MIAVFLSFVGSPVPSLKMLGLGLATAILIDAAVIRMVLVPAAMALLGDANWWLPSWLDRVLPRLTVDEPHAVDEPHTVDEPHAVDEQGTPTSSDQPVERLTTGATA
jgi:RND superfamily putative drug exporter